MSRKALPSILLHKSEVIYRDTGISKNLNCRNIFMFMKFTLLHIVQAGLINPQYAGPDIPS